jgi:GR25 family glycosyltransferase involved in LPS biosynthesis
MDHNKKILKNFEYIKDIKFFDGRLGKAWDVLNDRGIRQDVWAPYDGRLAPPLPGELGVWVSTLAVFDYIVENDVQELLVLEDDIKLNHDFVERFSACLQDLPDNYDFLSLHWFDGHNEKSEETDIGSRYIHRSYNQYSGGQAMLYSLRGARRLKTLAQRLGIVYTSDCFIFRQSLDRTISGFSVVKETGHLLAHDNINVASTIDPENLRNI